MKILAIDLGKVKSVACDYESRTAVHQFETVRTEPAIPDDLLRRRRPDRVVIEVGPRLSEAAVAIIDDPHRFKKGRQVAAYAGLVPRVFQSRAMDPKGRITGAGNRYLRSILVEISWLGLRNNPWMRQVFDRVCRGCPSRRKIAIVAVARRVLIWCWAMMRDDQDWNPRALEAAIWNVDL